MVVALAVVMFCGGLSLLLASIYSIKPANNPVSGEYDFSKQVAYFNGRSYSVPPEIIKPLITSQNLLSDAQDEQGNDVLGSDSKKSKEKRIEVDLSKQKLYAYEGSNKKMSFDVSTGKWAETPTGEYQIWTKLKYTLMTGGNKDDSTYYYLPNVPYTMYFHEGYGIHGAYWHDNFGHPMSHGCINMRIADAEKLFYWANPALPENSNNVLASEDNRGTKVVIYGETPRE